MTPTLADVMMITGLNITAPDTFFSLPAKATHQIKSKNIDDWKGYIGFYSKSVGSVDSKEHFAFLNMWLVWLLAATAMAFIFLPAPASAENYQVGGATGWNLSYPIGWPEGKTFRVGDNLGTKVTAFVSDFSL